MTSTYDNSHYENSSLHDPFLERAADTEAQEAGNNGLGAFLTLRLIDQFSADREKIHREATTYQTTATGEFLNDIYPQTPEVTHLRELVRVAGTALETNDRRLLLPPMMAFAFWLEQELRLAEALDVLNTALRLSDGRDGEEEVAAYLQYARVLRMQGDFEDARESYAHSGSIAARIGDKHSVLLSQIGHGVVLQKVGNLPGSERILREVIVEAERTGDHDAEARARHDLSVTLYFAGRISEGAHLTFRAFELYEQSILRFRALSDTGVFLKELGHYSEAKKAFLIVLGSNPPRDVRARTVTELLDLGALTDDRVSFERWRRDLAVHYDQLPPDDQVDFDMKVASGLSVFGRHPAAVKHYERALQVAEQCHLGERIFAVEKLLRDQRERRTKEVDHTAPRVSKEVPDEYLVETLDGLNALAVPELTAS